MECMDPYNPWGRPTCRHTSSADDFPSSGFAISHAMSNGQKTYIFSVPVGGLNMLKYPNEE